MAYVAPISGFSKKSIRHGLVFAVTLTTAQIMIGAEPLFAQDGPAKGTADYVEGLKSCQTLTDDIARLACFDTQVSKIVTASDTGEVQVIDREDVRQTKRSLFGFNVPNIKIFGDGRDDAEQDGLFRTTIASVQYLSSRSARFTTAEGAVWEMKDIPRRLRRIEEGDTAEFKGAALGTFFIRINNQLGIKGRRVR